VPGRNPHPTADPRGHSYVGGGHGEPASAWRAEAWRELDEYLYGCDLYNHAYWWEAHEAWEALWRAAPLESVERHYLQGLIQISASQLKLFVGDVRGVERLMASSSGHLAGVPDEFMGIGVRDFMERVRSYLLARLTQRPLGHDEEAFPYLYLAE
jgi:predicted metal-dependent hydrolase